MKGQDGIMTKGSSPVKSSRRASLSIVNTSTTPAPFRKPLPVAPCIPSANAPISNPLAPSNASSSSSTSFEGTRSFSLSQRETSAPAKTSQLVSNSSTSTTKMMQRPDSAARSRQISLPQVLHVPPSRSSVPVVQQQAHNAEVPSLPRANSTTRDASRPSARTSAHIEDRCRQPFKRFSFPASTPSSKPTAIPRDAGPNVVVAKGSLSPVLEGKEADLVSREQEVASAEQEEEEPWQYIKCRPRGPDGRFIRYAGEDDDDRIVVADSRNEDSIVQSNRRAHARPHQPQRKRTPSLPAHHAFHLFSASRLRSESGNARKSSIPSSTTKPTAFADSRHMNLPLPASEGSRIRSASANDAVFPQSKLRKWRKSLLRPPSASSNHPASNPSAKKERVANGSLPTSPTAGLQAWSQALQSDLDDSFITSGGSVYDWSSDLAILSHHGSELFEDSGIGSFSISLSSTSEEQDEEEEEGAEYDDQGGLLPPRYLLPYISRSGSSSWQIHNSGSREGATLKVSTSRQSHLRRVSCPEILLTPSGSSLLGPSTLFSPSEQIFPAVVLPSSPEKKAETSTPPSLRKRNFIHDLPKASIAKSTSQKTATSSAKAYRQLSPAPEALFGPLMRRPSTTTSVPTAAEEVIDEDATIRPTRPRTVKRVSFSSPTRPGRSSPTGGSAGYVFPVSEEGFGARTKLELLPRDLNTDLEVRPWMVVAPRFVLDDCGVGVRDWDRDRQESGDSL